MACTDTALHDHGHDTCHAGTSIPTHHGALRSAGEPIVPGDGAAVVHFLGGRGLSALAQPPERTHQVIQFTWLAGLPFHMADGRLATFTADWGFLLDPLSAVMILVVTGIGFLIHVYSVGYMAP